jgi:hypothetical protein
LFVNVTICLEYCIFCSIDISYFQNIHMFLFHFLLGVPEIRLHRSPRCYTPASDCGPSDSSKGDAVALKHACSSAFGFLLLISINHYPTIASYSPFFPPFGSTAQFRPWPPPWNFPFHFSYEI